METKTHLSRKREAAKLGSGAAAMQVVIHGAMAASNDRVTLLGFTHTQQSNIFAAVGWAVIATALAAYAWGRKHC